MPDAPAAPQVHWLLRIDRRLVYLFLLVALTVPLVAQKFTNKLTMKPAPLPSARKLFDRIEQIAKERDEAVKEGKPWNKIVFLGSEVEPQTRGELYPQAEAVIRHLMMRRLKFAVMTLTAPGTGYCKSIPEKVARELGREYGQDWANFGYQVGGSLRLQQMGKNIPETLKADADDTPMDKIPCMKGIKDAGDVPLVIEISGLVGTLGSWINYFASEKSRPDMADGCTAVSVTDSFAYLESKQIVGLLEGIAGAAAYNEFINEIRQPDQPYASADPRKAMTSQTVAHVLIILFVALGNIGVLLAFIARRRKGAGQ